MEFLFKRTGATPIWLGLRRGRHVTRIVLVIDSRRILLAVADIYVRVHIDTEAKGCATAVLEATGLFISAAIRLRMLLVADDRR